jgi:hypothetical protein
MSQLTVLVVASGRECSRGSGSGSGGVTLEQLHCSLVLAAVVLGTTAAIYVLLLFQGVG